MVYECLIARDLTFKLKKTHLNMPCVTFLGHMIDESGRYPCVEKVKAIMEKDYPKTDTIAVSSFIGMTLFTTGTTSMITPSRLPLSTL